ncbi:MAG: hypothetical protein Q8R98_08565, partial [Rubrivivax sp.]|nr:hypothetical protein [Rubrivivax sp.]
GSSACVRLLLDESAGPNAPTGSIEAFQRAWLVLFQRDEDMPEDGSIAEMLIGAGADPLRRGHLPNESCVVLQAATRMRPAALERLAAITNLPLTEENWLGRTPLAMVISKSGSDRFDLGRSKRCAEALLKAGVPGLETAEAYRKKKRVFWEIKKSEKREALLSFVENWERDEIASVVGQGSDPNETTNKKKRRGL